MPGELEAGQRREGDKGRIKCSGKEVSQMNVGQDDIIYYDAMRNEEIRKGRRVDKSKVDQLKKASQDVCFVFITYAFFVTNLGSFLEMSEGFAMLKCLS